ncbi:MAG: hypothetical protein Q9225_006609 [Loekoesia sp. 1 TL-2023]
MSGFLQSVRQGFSNRQAARTNGTANPGQQRSQNGSPVTGSSNMPSNNGPASFPVTAGPAADDTLKIGADALPEPNKWFFIEDYAKLGIKGNMLPLVITPTEVDIAEWLAHQMQRWIVGKIHDPNAFPTDSPFGTSAPSFEASYPTPNIPGSQRPIPAGPTTLNRTLSDLSGRNWFGKAAGFPETFTSDVRTAWRQMFRIYAHLYHAHFIEPFWHIHKNACNDLNSAFSFFASVGKLFGLLGDRDFEPMQPLINIWVANGSIPADCASGAQDIVQ